MTRPLNHAFLSSPKGFANRHVLLLAEPPANINNPRLPRHIKDVRALRFGMSTPSPLLQSEYESVESDYQSVESAYRVAFGDIQPGTQGDRTAGAQVVDVRYVHAPGRFPLFWLPYKQNLTRKITLKDKRPPHVIRRTGGEARIFFTSALNGCSVFIEGSEEEPTVYHLNAGSTRITQSREPTQTDLHDDRIHRTLEMERRFNQLPRPSNMRSATPRQREQMPQPGQLHAGQYLPNYFLDPQQSTGEEAFNQHTVRSAERLERIAPTSVQRHQVNHSALVFGWKSHDTGRWEFWLQTRARVDLTTTNGLTTTYVGNGLTRFWPGEHNHLFVREDTSQQTVVTLRRL
ncbi:hypothetical protein KYC5002_04715 [Archangium violaceum]|uniref:hypothetical protein n=1 Tax=Archangium violaceum TaxID=83451 RepID=UPI002B2881C7|nr:hypothetical protein KYC5002_04715 [Archangium gephyra]